MGDVGSTRLVIIDPVTVSGEVATYLNFQVGGVNAGQTVNADATPTFATTTATTVAFGLLQDNTEYVLAQDLSVTTNARNGFTVTLQADGDLQSVSGATIDSFSDGTATPTPVAWAAPSGTLGNANTYGHWGITTEDTTLSDNDSFGNALYVGNFIGVPREVMYSDAAANGTTPDSGATRVDFKLETTPMQEAATDYTARLTYVVTPVF